MRYKKILLSLVATTGMAFPLIAPAIDLLIVNNTDKESTSVTNKGWCSTKVLGKEGITHAHSSKVVKDLQLRLACMKNLDNCVADVYMTDNCTGPIAAVVTLSVKSGIKSVESKIKDYAVSWTATSIRVDQPIKK